MEKSDRRPAICLLSGGMDSSFALYWSTQHPHIQPALAVFFNYGQKGAGFEWRAAKLVANSIGVKASYIDVTGLAGYLGGAIMQGAKLPDDPRDKDDLGNAATFVPGRNLLHLAMLSNLLYTTGMRDIVGGWNAVDVDYPDCSAEFLTAMGATLTLALGSMDRINIHAPAIQLTKDEIVQKGNQWSVPWDQTRSCYADSFKACGECDSCLVRAKAFWINNMPDPAYEGMAAWRRTVRHMIDLGYIDPGGQEAVHGQATADQ